MSNATFIRCCLILSIRLALEAAARADDSLPASLLVVPEPLEVTVWAKAPLFHNPTNLDVDDQGRIWVTEAVNYRRFKSAGDSRKEHPAGDRVMILEDTDQDGVADRSTVFVQDQDLVAPLGIAVFGNRVVVSCSPSLIMYTDVNRNGRFEPDIDKKERLLSGFGGIDHDHGLHSVVAGPDGRWYFNAGNAGPHVVTDASGWTLRAGSWYTGGTPHNTANTPGLKSDDGRVYVGGLALAIEPDGHGMTVFAHNFRNNYEMCLDSFGNAFQNDNDDQVVACRTSWLMQYSNAGYSSADGERSWQVDRRPDQPIPVAHWHQDDPGVLPYGDLYGAGSPTGMVVYEGDALGAQYRGLLLSCDAGRNVVFGYHVQPQGAGFTLQRFSFLSSGLPDDRLYEWNKLEQDQRKWFRPSDVAVGTDGAIYVADWFDPIVGGHAMHDRVGAGTIYRVAPKGRKLARPSIHLDSVAGQISALKSPAPNVRFLGFERLLTGGEDSLAAVTELLADENPYVRARAVWLLARLGPAARRVVIERLGDDDPQTRIAAFRALRRSGEKVISHARRLAADPEPAVRREVALALRDTPFADCEDILMRIAEQFDGHDRWYLEALGTGCEGKEDQVFSGLVKRLGDAPQSWDERLAGITWRLHAVGATGALATRAMSDGLTTQQRRQAVDALAFIQHADAAEALVQVARNGPADVRVAAAWWIEFRRHNLWRGYPVAHSLARDDRAALVAGVTMPGPPSYTSPRIRRGDVADISADISGARRLYLVVTDAGDGNTCDWADWLEPRLARRNGEVALTELDWKQAVSQYGEVVVGKNCAGSPLRVNGRRVDDGIGTHASSVIVYDLADGGFQWFTARGGLDNGRRDLGGTDFPAAEPSVVFQVYHDGPTPEQQSQVHESMLLDADAPPEQREEAALAMARSRAGGLRLLALASQSKLPRELLDPVTRHIFRNPDLTVRTLAGQYFARAEAAGGPLAPFDELLKLKGDARRGRDLVFGRARCGACHKVSGQGQSVGPDLTGIGRKLDRTRLFDSVLNPSASIVFGYETWLIQTAEGRVLTGFVIGEGDPTVLMDAQGERHTIPLGSIDFRQRQTVSVMPEFANSGLTTQDLADVVEFLSGQ